MRSRRRIPVAPFQAPLHAKVDYILDVLRRGIIVDSEDVVTNLLPDGRLSPRLRTPITNAGLAFASSPPAPPGTEVGGSFTEFYCENGGSNLNGGSNPGAAKYTCTNSNWNGGANVFTPTDGSTPASSIVVGDFASVYLDAATIAVYIARVTAVAPGVNGAITLSTTADAGLSPTTGATGRSIRVGGAWKGPNGSVTTIPFGLTNLGNLINSNGDYTRVNMKNDATYAMTNQIGASGVNNVLIQGYSSIPGDGGKVTIDGGTTGGSFTLFAPSNNGVAIFKDLIFSNNGATGTSILVSDTIGAGKIWIRCVFHHARGNAYQNSGGNAILIECEAYDANQSNTAGLGGFTALSNGSSKFIRCISHHNVGSNAHGFSNTSTNPNLYFNCIADSNGGVGFKSSGSTLLIHYFRNCDAYNNGSDGISCAGNPLIESCNFVKNGGFGINITDPNQPGTVYNCGYGSGSQANAAGDSDLGSVIEIGKVTYAADVNPWAGPSTGDFRIVLAAAKNAGRGEFTQTAPGYGGTVAYPDIGATQHLG